MSPAELRVPVLAAVQALLRPLGYRKASSLFARQSVDVVHLIEVQGSRYSSSAEARFTVNVGVFALELVYPDVRDVTKPSMPAAHWRERLGFLSPEREDLWWKVSTLAQAEAAAQDIAVRLELYALPALSGLPDLEALVSLWHSGRSPGLTEHQRQEFLARLHKTERQPQNGG